MIDNRVKKASKANRRTARGFTLIELMVVVAIVGVLAVLASYGVRSYVSNAKTAEATSSVGIMAQDAVAAYEREGMGSTVLATKTSSSLARQFCNSASASVPAAATSISGKKYQSKASDWNVDAAGNSGFACLKFTMDAPQYYMYSYNVSGTGSSGNTFTAMAQGDLNGDGVLSLFSLTGSVTAAMTVAVAPNILTVRPQD